MVPFCRIGDFIKGAARPKLGGHECPHTGPLTEDFLMIHEYLYRVTQRSVPITLLIGSVVKTNEDCCVQVTVVCKAFHT